MMELGFAPTRFEGQGRIHQGRVLLIIFEGAKGNAEIFYPITGELSNASVRPNELTLKISTIYPYYGLNSYVPARL